MPQPRAVTGGVEQFLDLIGLAPTPGLVLTPSCGLAGADPEWARTALSLCRTAAADLS